MAERFSKETEALIRRLRAERPAPAPFELSAGRSVTNPEVFHASLLDEAARGRLGPEWRENALRADLEIYLAHLGRVSRESVS